MATPIGNDEILDRLANDDQFREQMLGDPVGTLGALGVVIDPALVPAVRSLPSKDSLQKDKTAIQASLDHNLGMIPLILSAKP
jgi:putative modified peptide